jgi:hypothetical protein
MCSVSFVEVVESKGIVLLLLVVVVVGISKDYYQLVAVETTTVLDWGLNIDMF